MSKKLSRRKKASPVKRGRKTFTITVEAQPMVVSYEPRWLKSDFAHLEFRSPHKPARRIPVSDTGYMSHFVSMDDVKAAKSPQDFAHEEALALLRSRRRAWDATDELPLF
jgi:hypothetical protein